MSPSTISSCEGEKKIVSQYPRKMEHKRSAKTHRPGRVDVVDPLPVEQEPQRPRLRVCAGVVRRHELRQRRVLLELEEELGIRADDFDVEIFRRRRRRLFGRLGLGRRLGAGRVAGGVADGSLSLLGVVGGHVGGGGV